MTNASTTLSWLFEQRLTRFLFCDWLEHLGIFLVFFSFTARSSIPSISMSNLVSMLYDTSVDEVARLREVRRLSSNGPPSKASAETILLGPGWGRRSQVSDQYTRTRKRNDESVSVKSRLRGVASTRRIN